MVDEVIKFPLSNGKTFEWEAGTTKVVITNDDPMRLSTVNLILDEIKYDIMLFQNRQTNYVGNHVSNEE